MNNHKVIGYVSLKVDKTGIFTDGPACLIAGSSGNMEKYIQTEDPGCLNKQVIKKTRLGEIIKGMELGAEYQFDEISYDRFNNEIKDTPISAKMQISQKEKEAYNLKFYNVVIPQV